MPRSHTIIPTSPRQRSAITNNIYRLPKAIDGRSAAARRWRDLAAAVVQEFGDKNAEAARDITGIRYAVEQAQHAVVAGEPRGKEDLVRLHRILARKEAVLRQQVLDSRSSQPMTLAEYLAARTTSRDEDDE
jgi:hypothetical protein